MKYCKNSPNVGLPDSLATERCLDPPLAKLMAGDTEQALETLLNTLNNDYKQVIVMYNSQ